MALEHTQVIAAPIGRVFKLIDDPEQMKLWMQGLEQTVVVSRPESGRIGTRFRQRLRQGGRIAEYEGEITAYEKPDHLGLRLGNPSFSFDVDYRLSTVEGGTRVSYTATLTHRTFLSRITDVLVRPLTKRLLRRQMQALKEVAEAGR